MLYFILPKSYNFFSAVIVSIDNQSNLDDNIKIAVLNKIEYY